VTANSDSLEIEVTGTGGHASAPHGTVDPVVVAAQFIMAAQCASAWHLAVVAVAVTVL